MHALVWSSAGHGWPAWGVGFFKTWRLRIFMPPEPHERVHLLHFDHLVTSQSFGHGVHAQPMMDMRVGHARPPYIGGTVT